MLKIEIDEAIELNPKSEYSKALRVIRSLKDKFGNCSCVASDAESGIMSTPAYVSIQFSQCRVCKAYSFRQDQINSFIMKVREERKEIKDLPKQIERVYRKEINGIHLFFISVDCKHYDIISYDDTTTTALLGYKDDDMVLVINYRGDDPKQESGREIIINLGKVPEGSLRFCECDKNEIRLIVTPYKIFN